MRERLGGLGVPVPAWTARDAGRPTSSPSGTQQGWPVVVKTASGGYDGKGVWFPATSAEAVELFDRIGASGRVYVEARVPFDRELSAMVGRSASGEMRVWPVVETVQTDGVCTEVLAPAPGLDPRLVAEAQTIARSDRRGPRRGRGDGGRAVRGGGQLLVNELAMRPHNSGHWTIEGARTSQFEQHLRAVLGWPLGETTPGRRGDGDGQRARRLRARSADDLAGRLPQVLALDPGVHVHLYGKGVRAGRKIGHISVVGDDVVENRRRARAAADLLQGDPCMTLVGVIMGSDSDWPTMSGRGRGAGRVRRPVRGARRLGPPHAARDAGLRLDAAGRGLRVIIAGAGGAAHLPGMVASMTPLPVIGVPVPLKHLDGMDSLLSIVQMPAGVPVATVSIGGARNAGLLAVRILASADPALAGADGGVPGGAGADRARQGRRAAGTADSTGSGACRAVGAGPRRPSARRGCPGSVGPLGRVDGRGSR